MRLKSAVTKSQADRYTSSRRVVVRRSFHSTYVLMMSSEPMIDSTADTMPTTVSADIRSYRTVLACAVKCVICAL